MTDNLRRKRIFEQCVDQHSDSMYRVAFRLTGCEDLARELVQETYLNAWANIESLSDVKKMKSWMFAIMRNQYTKILRRLSRSSGLTRGSIEETAETEQTDSTDDLELQIRIALDQLHENQKLPLLLVAMEGFSVEEAAQSLSVPPGTVLSRMHRGREKLKTILIRMNPDWKGPNNEGPTPTTQTTANRGDQL